MMKITICTFIVIFVVFPTLLIAQTESNKPFLNIDPIITVNTDSDTQNDSTKLNRIRENWGTFNELGLVAGYTINRRNGKTGIDNHIFELGLYKSRNSYYAEPAGYSYYFANEFMFNKDSFYIGPKIGAFAHIWLFYLGAELVYYTNFKGDALHLVPIFGLGYSQLKIGFGLHIPLTNNLFEKTNVASIGFTYQIKELKKNKIKH